MGATQVVCGDSYELRFASLFNPGRGLSFTCNSSGEVNIDALSERGRANYLYARAMIGREFAFPAVMLQHSLH